MNKKVILMILDGWGIATNPNVSAIDKANTPFVDSLYKNYPHSTLEASGLAVGLPDGQMGNSEVGHLNIGAGRVVNQMLVRINKAVAEQTLDNNEVLLDAFSYAETNKKAVHLIGLVSDGGVHSHIEHLKALCSIAKNEGVDNLFIHIFTDGRDTDPKAGLAYIDDVAEHLEKTTGKIASICGRYYAMDRDKRWERVKIAYDALVNGIGDRYADVQDGIKNAYQNGITDEFIKPIIAVDHYGEPIATIQEGDVVLCFNFRTDRGREITQVLTQKDFPDFEMAKLPLYYVTLTRYDESFENVKVMFEEENLSNTLGEVLEKAGKKQIRIAETEKYPHVTFFFSGGREDVFVGEKRLMCPSPKVATYDLQPEMSAEDIKNLIIPEINSKEPDFICLNFANPDMVGHTGVMSAAIKACETVDRCAKEICQAVLANDYVAIIIADHGNADCMINPDGTPNTAHTTNLVPCFLVSNDLKNISLQNGKLADLAPTILKLIGIAQPKEMNGKTLF